MRSHVLLKRVFTLFFISGQQKLQNKIIFFHFSPEPNNFISTPVIIIIIDGVHDTAVIFWSKIPKVLIGAASTVF
jgi:hypothetical protein